MLRSRHGRRSDDVGLRFGEAVLSIGERVTVVGTGVRKPYVAPAAETDYRAAFPTRLHVAATKTAPLSITSHYLP